MFFFFAGKLLYSVTLRAVVSADWTKFDNTYCLTLAKKNNKRARVYDTYFIINTNKNIFQI